MKYNKSTHITLMPLSNIALKHPDALPQLIEESDSQLCVDECLTTAQYRLKCRELFGLFNLEDCNNMYLASMLFKLYNRHERIHLKVFKQPEGEKIDLNINDLYDPITGEQIEVKGLKFEPTKKKKSGFLRVITQNTR